MTDDRLRITVKARLLSGCSGAAISHTCRAPLSFWRGAGGEAWASTTLGHHHARKKTSLGSARPTPAFTERSQGRSPSAAKDGHRAQPRTVTERSRGRSPSAAEVQSRGKRPVPERSRGPFLATGDGGLKTAKVISVNVHLEKDTLRCAPKKKGRAAARPSRCIVNCFFVGLSCDNNTRYLFPRLQRVHAFCQRAHVYLQGALSVRGNAQHLLSGSIKKLKLVH